MRALLIVALSSLAMVVSSTSSVYVYPPINRVPNQQYPPFQPYPNYQPYQPYFNTSAKQAYDPNTEKCCQGSVSAKLPLGDPALQKCCGIESIDSTLQLCCNGVVKENKGGQACCRNTTYDPHSSLCCNGKVIPVPKDEMVNAFCCGDAYASRKAHLCCGGRTVVEKKSGTDQCCGMSNAYNREKEICCFNFGTGLNVSQSTIIQKEGNKSFCCHGKAYDPKEQVCCGTRLAPAGSSCCGDKDFDRKTEACCHSTKGFEVLKKEGNATVCCFDKLYNPDKQICCGGNLTEVPKNPAYQFGCCGTHVYDTTKHFCQFPYRTYGYVPQIHTFGSQNHTFGSQNHTFVAQKPKLVPISGAYNAFCGEQSYNFTTQMCCDNRKVVEKPDQFANQCCGDKAFSWNKGTCCRKGNESKYYEDRVSCCGLNKIDYKTQICCGDKIQAKIQGMACCGDQQFNWTKQLCCRDFTQQLKPKSEVTEKQTNTTACCGMKTFDYKTEICCGNEVHQKDGKMLSCCGMKHTYDPKTHICCGQNVIAKNKEGQSACCFYGMGDNFNLVQPRPIY